MLLKWSEQRILKYALNSGEETRNVYGKISKFGTSYCLSTLRILADEHQENLPYYLEAEGYDGVLKVLDKVLDFFEEELGQDDRQGQWLGGGQLCVADITLGEEIIMSRRCFICSTS